MSFSTIIILVVVAIIVWLVFTFNRLVVLRMRSKESLSDIDVQTKRRYDLIPNLVETVKGYMTHEKDVLENVTKARTEAMAGSGDAVDKASKENALSNTLKTLFAVSENYPDLKANANFLELQRELSDTENKIQAARRFYNSNVKGLNIKVETFPTRLVAGAFGFSKMKFFEVTSEAEKEPVNVKF
ncbi:MAG: LemA family protein [Candidatus Marinimicrobia bacterium]|nr:LemA family protein [Candidatus Neomarinimicrobiota bacterium]